MPDFSITDSLNDPIEIGKVNWTSDDSFRLASIVPARTAYAGLSITGLLDLEVSGSSGDLTFGIDANSSITVRYLKAFATDGPEPALGAATAELLSNYVIPVSVADLTRLGVNDVCCISGRGRLEISGDITVATPVNPLASLNLPLQAGTVAVRDGAMAGLSTSLKLTDSYQIRLEKLTECTLRLSYVKEHGTTLQTDLTASAGVAVKFEGTDLLAKLLETIGTDAIDKKLLDGLTPDESGTFTQAIKDGIDHSLRASLDLKLSLDSENEAAFQYEIQPALLTAESSRAVERALKGDLRPLTALEDKAGDDGAIAPGVKLLNSVFSAAKSRGVSLKVNLLGIVNLISMSKLIDNCEFVFEPSSGDLTIKETAQSEQIGAISDPLKRQEALRKALFYSVLATTTYVVGKAVAMPELSCQAVHSAVNQNTNPQTISEYTTWFLALRLIGPGERAQVLSAFAKGGPSTCTVRTQLDEELCEALFFDAQGRARPFSEYLEIGRQAMKALLDPASSDIDRSRYQFLDSSSTWVEALKIGPSPQLRTLIPLSSTDPKFSMVLADITGDFYDIVWWATGMQKAGQALEQMRAFIAAHDPASLRDDPAFAWRRDDLQKLMRDMVASSKVRFHEPWGIVCLFEAAGARGSSGRLSAGALVIERPELTGAALHARSSNA